MNDALRLAAIEAVVRRAVREELLAAGLVPRCTDSRLPAFLSAWYAFGGDASWTCGEALAEARLSRRCDLLAALDAIVGGAADQPKALGRFLQRHAGAEVDGLRLARVRREGGVWLYTVSGECLPDSLSAGRGRRR